MNKNFALVQGKSCVLNIISLILKYASKFRKFSGYTVFNSLSKCIFFNDGNLVGGVLDTLFAGGDALLWVENYLNEIVVEELVRLLGEVLVLDYFFH